MRFSVVIATKGRPDALARTLDSLSRCDPGPVEAIVVDGDEAQSARRVVDGREDVPVRYLASEPGLTRQRNRGIEEAAGDVVVFVDDDVAFAPSVFSSLTRAYADSSVIGATGLVVEEQGRRFGNTSSAARRLLPGGGEEGTMTRFGYPRRIQDVRTPRDVEFMQGCLMSARRDVAERVGFDERLTGYGLAEDEDFSYRLSRLGRVRYEPAIVVEHEGTGAQASATRAFNRTVVVNRVYLFRKNFSQTLLARLQFAMLVGIFVVHRAINCEWRAVQGLAEGSIEAWRGRA
ncbi:glycosyltransferase family 2 protein [soil metagenome]